jgi:thiol-disulfide isomerase/thioredoxin
VIEAFNLGPFLIPTRPLLLLLCLVFAIWLAGRLARRFGLNIDQVKRTTEHAAWLGVVGARLVFVVVNFSAYRFTPWTILYFWQPGYMYLGGLLFGGACMLWQSSIYQSNERKTFLAVITASYLLATIIFLSTIASLELLRPSGVPGKGDLAPDMQFLKLDGDTVGLSDLKGRGIVLNFWATWCPPCRREMPMLDEFHKNYSDDGLSVIGLAVNEPAAQVRQVFDSMGLSYPVWVDAPGSLSGVNHSQAVFNRYGGVGLPMTIFIDRKGIIREVYVGELSRGYLQSQADLILAK